VERFGHLQKFFRKLLEEYDPITRLLNKGSVKVLELGAGTGIAGAALSRALTDLGVEVEIDFTDVRSEDLGIVDRWVEESGLNGLKYRKYVLDCRYIPRHVDRGGYDLVVFLGSSLAHLDIFEYTLTVSGIHGIIDNQGFYIAEQYNLGWNLLRSRGFQEFILENRLENGEGIISIYAGYDEYRGVQHRRYYRIPGMEYLGVMKSRLWDIASIVGINWIFFRNVDILSFKDFRDTKVILSWRKRGEAPSWTDLYSSIHKG